jgi:hypothetical protein
MQVIHGRIRSILRGSAGEMNGFILERGIEVRFPSAHANQVSAISEVGSQVEIRGWARPGPAGGTQFNATSILNCDSSQIADLKDLPHTPEVPSFPIPTSEETASLAPLPRSGQGSGATAGRSDQSIQKSSEKGWKRVVFAPSPLAEPDSQGSGSAAFSTWTARESAIKGIERAYDGLHRAQAMLAYFKIVELESPDVGQLFDGAKLNYEQALSAHRKQEFPAASELAAASSGLSLAAEFVISRAFRASAKSPTLVPPPPLRPATSAGAAQVQDRLLLAQRLLSRIHWLLENGTMPAEEIREVQKVATWSETFLHEAQQEIRTGGCEDSMDLANTAFEIAHAAEHICKKCYVSREDTSHFTVTAQPSD